MIHSYKCFFSSDGEEKTVSFVSQFLLTHAAVLHFFLYKGTPCLKLLITASNVIGRWGITVEFSLECPLNRNNWFVLHKLQYTKRLLLRSRHYLFVTSQTERDGGEWDCECAQNLNPCCFVPCGKLNSACVFIAVMADWNRSNHFDTPCTYI